MASDCTELFGDKTFEEANPSLFTDYLIEGYESIVGEGSVDRERLQRMLGLRMYFYEKFCRTAKA